METYDVRFVAQPFGQRNIGAICWMNSLTQCLYSLPSFNKIAIKNKEELMKIPTARAYIEAIECFMSLDDDEETASDILSHIDRIPHYCSYDILQNLLGYELAEEIEDRIAKEVPGVPMQLMVEIDKIIQAGRLDELKMRAAGTNNEDRIIRSIESLDGDSEQHKFIQELVRAYPNVKDNTLSFGQNSASEGFVKLIEKFCDNELFGLFNIRYRSSMTCPSCNAATIFTADQSCMIVIEGNRSIRDEETFTQYLKYRSHDLEDYRCEKCEVKHAVVKKEESLKLLQPIITVVFSNQYTKGWGNASDIYYPQKIKFQKKDGLTLKYELIATIEHSGSLHGGHYWARAKRGKYYYQFNDASVHAIRDLSPQPTTYMAFYHLMTEE